MKTIPQLLQLCDEIRNLENLSEYAQGIEILRPIWPNLEDWPEVSFEEGSPRARVLLRCGSLAGFMGRSESNEKLQSHSRDLLFAAWEIASKEDDEELIAEIENQLANSFSRMNEHSEAKVWLDASMDRDVPDDSYARIESFMIFSIVLNQSRKFVEQLEFLVKVEPKFKQRGQDFFLGALAGHRGIALSKLGRFEEAAQQYEMAAFFHSRYGNLRSQAIVKNNLAMLNARIKRFSDAKECVSQVLDYYEDIGDKSRFGGALDTLAFIHLGERDYPKALEVIDQSIEVLSENMFVPLLVDSFVTKTKILLEMGGKQSAFVAFLDASNLIRQFGENEQLEGWIDRFSKLLEEHSGKRLNEIRSERLVEGKEMRIVLPPEISEYRNFDGIWITNEHLESRGITKGALALVINEKPKDGEFGALIKQGSADVICGEFGYFDEFVSVQISETVPELLNVNEVEILGRIIGYVDPSETDREVWKAKSLI